jgi:hypothetical protein
MGCCYLDLASLLSFFLPLLKRNPNLIFLIQTDETEFLESFQKRFPNSFFFSEIPTIKKSNTSIHDVIQVDKRVDAASYFLAVTKILSKNSHLITHSGNCGLWSILFRGSSKNTYQYLNHQGFESWIINN